MRSTHSDVGIQRAQKIFDGLAESGFPDFGKFNDRPSASPSFIVHLLGDFNIKVDAETHESEWCCISFYYQTNPLKAWGNEISFPIKHLDDLCDKIFMFENGIKDFSGPVGDFHVELDPVKNDEVEDIMFHMEGVY